MGIRRVLPPPTAANDLTKAMLGLGNVDNTSDVNKPLSTVTIAALNLKADITSVTAGLALKANIASPTFTGTVVLPTVNINGVASFHQNVYADANFISGGGATYLGNVSIDGTLSVAGYVYIDDTIEVTGSIVNAPLTSAIGAKANANNPTFTGSITTSLTNNKGLLLAPSSGVIQQTAAPSDSARPYFDGTNWQVNPGGLDPLAKYVLVEDDFLGGNAAAGTIGREGWLFATTGGTVTQNAVQNHPGVINLATGGTSNNFMTMYLPQWFYASDILKTVIIFRVISASMSNSQITLGFMSAAASSYNLNSGRNGFILNYNATTYPAWYTQSWSANAAVTSTQILATPIVNTWYALEMTKVSATSQNIKITDIATPANTGNATVTGIPSTALNAISHAYTLAALNKGNEVDYFGFVMNPTRA